MQYFIFYRRFAIENLRLDFENKLREKTLIMEQMDRSFQEALDLKSRELMECVDRLRYLEAEVNLKILHSFLISII